MEVYLQALLVFIVYLLQLLSILAAFIFIIFLPKIFDWLQISKLPTTQQWAVRIAEQSQQANWPNIGQLYDLLGPCLKNRHGHLIYIALADQNGHTEDIGVVTYPPESVVGYYTDGHSFALAFTYPNGLEQPECIYRTNCPQVCIPALAQQAKKKFVGRR